MEKAFRQYIQKLNSALFDFDFMGKDYFKEHFKKDYSEIGDNDHISLLIAEMSDSIRVAPFGCCITIGRMLPDLKMVLHYLEDSARENESGEEYNMFLSVRDCFYDFMDGLIQLCQDYEELEPKLKPLANTLEKIQKEAGQTVIPCWLIEKEKALKLYNLLANGLSERDRDRPFIAETDEQSFLYVFANAPKPVKFRPIEWLQNKQAARVLLEVFKKPEITKGKMEEFTPYFFRKDGKDLILAKNKDSNCQELNRLKKIISEVLKSEATS